jgi:hypothetical protein
MARIDGRIRARRNPPARFGAVRRWAAIGLAAAALLALYYRYRQIPSVQAAGLLRKAVAVAQPPAPGARIRLHTRRTDLVRPASLPQGDDSAWARLFAQAGYDWALPFSARSFDGWRGRLTDKKDSVELQPADGDTGAPVYVIRTSSESNPLASATLVLRASDYLPVRETLEFRGSDALEITTAIPSTAAAAPAPQPLPALPHAAALPLAIRELRALTALHSIHADLGEVEMSAADQTLTIRSVGLGEARRDQIRQALASADGLDGVELSFDNDTHLPVEGGRAENPVRSAPESSLRASLALKLGSGVSIDEAIDRILDTSDAMLAQAFALRSLAARFPPEAEAALAESDRRTLAQLRDDYSGEFLRRFDRLAQLLSPLVAAVPPVKRDPAAWQLRAAAMLAAAKSLDAALSAGFASAGAAAPPDLMVQRLEQALREVSAAAGGLR